MAHILLVDDQRFMKEFLIYELTKMGHEANYVNDGNTLFAFLEERTPDLLLIDPDINDSKGWELLQEINRPGRPHMPILLFTTFGATLRDPRAVLADGLVIKNMNTQVLGEKILEVLSAREHLVSNRQIVPAFTRQDPYVSPGRFRGWLFEKAASRAGLPASSRTDWTERIHRPRRVLR